MNLVIKGHSFLYETENLLRVFFPTEKIESTTERTEEERYIITSLTPVENGADIEITVNIGESEKTERLSVSLKERDEKESDDTFLERSLEVFLYGILCKETLYTPPWGILTGVRPAKLMSNLLSDMNTQEAKNYFKNTLCVSEEKTNLAYTVSQMEEPIINKSRDKSFSLYVSIPFCPTRCSYCSFVSHSNESAKKLMPQYTELLVKEIEETAKITNELGLTLETVYIGGGTPTALDEESLKRVTDALSEYFPMKGVREYTIEAGRPDSITREKLRIIKNAGATRISINPQTFNDDVLVEIGRKHTAKQTEDAMLLAREEGFTNINMDLIAGLPADTMESFKDSLKKVLSFDAENITVHTLALKRSSTLVTEDRRKGSADLATRMLSYTYKTLTEKGYRPYYMYRQSKCLGNLENVGWAKEGRECEYNVYMMEETHTVLAVGAGAVIKLRNPKTKEIERIFNYKYPYEYISGFSEILSRKRRIVEFYNEIIG